MSGKRIVYLLCGVPGSGKTWVLDQLKDHFAIVENDRYVGVGSAMRLEALHEAAAISEAPLITDCPFAERDLRAKLLDAGFQVQPIFIIETPATVARRYRLRTGYPLPANSLTRATTILARADEWKAPRGTAVQVLELLRGVADATARGQAFELLTIETTAPALQVALGDARVDDVPPPAFAPYAVDGADE